MEMIDGMPRDIWLQWQIYLELEPPESYRAAIRDARLVKLLLDLTRDSKKATERHSIEDLIIRFGDDAAPAPTRKQTWQQQKALLFGYAKEQAAAMTASREKRRSRKRGQ